MPEREVSVHRFEQLLRREDERAEFEIECSSGTYVRSLIADARRRLLRERCGARRSVRFGSRTRTASRSPSKTRWVPARAGPGRAEAERVRTGARCRPPMRLPGR